MVPRKKTFRGFRYRAKSGMAAARASKSRNRSPPSDPQGMFSGMFVLLIETQVQTLRLQIWKQKLMQMGAVIADRLSNSVTHILALNSHLLTTQLDTQRLSTFKGSQQRLHCYHPEKLPLIIIFINSQSPRCSAATLHFATPHHLTATSFATALPGVTLDVVTYQWLEDSLKLGQKVAVDSYGLKLELKRNVHHKSSEEIDSEVVASGNSISSGEGLSQHKKIRPSPQDFKDINMDKSSNTAPSTGSSTFEDTSYSCDIIARKSCPKALHMPDKQNSVDELSSSMQYNPPDLNTNITEIFGKLVNIYRALGEERRSFSYHKAVGVIEKLPFKIESAEQVKDLPAIGKSMKDHIQEIVSTGKLSKLEHFETDEKVKTISLFGDVWGIGPATALKLYEMGHRTLEDLMNEDSLTNAQRLGLKYFDDIKMRIPRHEVQEMELLLQKAGEDILPGVLVLCGGSFRRGNSSCGDLDVIITHPDGTSNKGFLQKYVKHLKDMRFLREDLIFSIHSEQGTDSGVDTYFGFCTYPCRELRHRIDLKVYPRDIYAFGLIAWTGNDVLNRRLRLLAESKGYRLDDTGLFLATQSLGSKRGLRSSRSLSLKTEKEVFDYLGFPWLEPNERNL